MSFICMRIKNDFHITGSALCLAFKKKAWSNSEMDYSSLYNPGFLYFSPAAIRNVPGLNNICSTGKGTAFLYNQRMASSTFHLFQRQRMT